MYKAQKKNIKHRIFEIIEKSKDDDFISKTFDIIIISLIILNITIIIGESFIDNPDSEVNYDLLRYFFYSLDAIIVVTFTLEYILRLYVSSIKYQGISKTKALFKVFFSPLAIIELLSVTPFYLNLLGFEVSTLKAVRLFLILKIGRYFKSFTLIGEVFKKKRDILIASTSIMIILIIFSSVFMYYIENKIQPEQFPNIVATFWWAVATLTTVGYGDVYPITGMGRVLASIIAIAGIGIVALPTGVISSGFMEELASLNKEEDLDEEDDEYE